MAVWNGAQETLPARTTPALARHIGGCPGLVDEDELGPIHPWLPIAPSRACSRYVRPALLGGVERLFFKRQPARLEKSVDRGAADTDPFLRQRVLKLL